jgi:tungstate transport system ATP-binding protein
MTISLQLKDVSKNFRAVKAVDNVSLQLFGGKIIVLVGVNGAGKSSLLRVIAGLDKPDNGQLLFNNKSINDKSLRQVATLVFQKTVMFSMNVYDNLAYGLRFREMPEKEIKEKIDAALADVKLSGFEKRKAKKTSGGEQQRLALARAFLIEPEVLLLDEPTANLDPYSVTIIEKAVLARKSSDRIIVMATHNLNQARRIADQVIHLHAGRIVESGLRQGFFENPKNELTRKFINGELEF